MLQTNKSGSQGYTLIEVIISVVIVGIIAGVFAMVVASGMTSWLFMKGQKGMLLDASDALRRMSREMKRINGSNILAFTSSQCQFVDLSGNQIDYQQSGSDLMRNNAVLLGNLPANGLQFTYLDKNGNAAATAASIKIIQMYLHTQNATNQVRLMSAAGIRV